MRSSLLQTKREIGLIPALDHDAIEYEEFDKDFYEPCADIKNKTAQQVMHEMESK